MAGGERVTLAGSGVEVIAPGESAGGRSPLPWRTSGIVVNGEVVERLPDRAGPDAPGPGGDRRPPPEGGCRPVPTEAGLHGPVDGPVPLSPTAPHLDRGAGEHWTPERCRRSVRELLEPCGLGGEPGEDSATRHEIPRLEARLRPRPSRLEGWPESRGARSPGEGAFPLPGFSPPHLSAATSGGLAPPHRFTPPLRWREGGPLKPAAPPGGPTTDSLSRIIPASPLDTSRRSGPPASLGGVARSTKRGVFF